MKIRHFEGMDWLLHDAELRAGERLALSSDASRHAAALRLRQGEAVGLLNGRGQRGVGVIDHVGRATDVLVQRVDLVPPPADVTVAVGMLDHRDRMEFMIEKCTELAARRIVILACRRSQRHGVRRDRLVQKAEAAMLQCGRAWLPVIEGPVDVPTFCASVPEDARIVVGDQFGAAPSSVDLPVVIMVGPEGGFDDDELAIIERHGPVRWRIGNDRLRTETAAVVLTAAVQISLSDAT